MRQASHQRNDDGDAQSSPSENQRERQKAETRQRLLGAATEVFLETPPTTASLEDIAARAGVRRQTLLYHFGNRDGLMNGVLDHHLGSFRTQMQEWGGELQTVLESYLRAHRQPLVRLVRHLDAIAPESTEAPRAGSWYPVVAAQLEETLARAGVAPIDAGKRAPILALALLHMADRVAADRATDDEIRNFVDNACDLALAPGRRRSRP